MAGVLKVKVNGQWQEITSAQEPPMNEVWIGMGPPDPGVGTFELWVDTLVPNAPVLKYETPNGMWEPVSTGSEVEIGLIDPYVTDPNSEAELWVDTSSAITRAPTGAPPTPVQRSVSHFTNGTVPAGTYYHVATALNEFGESDPTAEDSITCDGTDAQSAFGYILEPSEGLVFHHYVSTTPGVYTTHMRVKNPDPNLASTATWVSWPDPNERPGAPGDVYPVPPPAAGVLKARIGDNWVEVVQQEVVVSDIAPLDPDTELWYDTSVVPGVLYVKVNGQWVPVTSKQEPPMNEVWIGTGPPDPAIGTFELWVDTLVPLAPVLKYETAIGEWLPVTSNEVVVGTVDPYTANPASEAELWLNLSIGQAGKLFGRYGGQWHPIAEFTESEVEIGPTDPVDHGIPPGTTELWVDSSTTPIVLKAWVNGGWQDVAGPQSLPAPQEVEVSPAQPRETTVELWYDTTNSPLGQLRANNNGVWEDIGGASEVFVGNTDPYVTNPLAVDELWVDTSKGAPGILKYRNAQQGTWMEVIVRATGVAFEQQYGQEPTAGTLNSLAREDHTHGTPLEEVVVGDVDPLTVPTGRGAELWYDTSGVSTLTAISNEAFTRLRQRVEALEQMIIAQGSR